MALPIPAFVSQIVPSSAYTVQVGGGTVQTLATARWYYLASNRTATTNGQSLLYALEQAANASLGGITWSFTLSSDLKVIANVNAGGSGTVTFSAALQALLGHAFSMVIISSGAALTFSYRSPYIWTPGMPISATGPLPWDPVVSGGVPRALGAAQQAPDGTPAYVTNGFLSDAELGFVAVDGYSLIRPVSSSPNTDLETWWRNGPARGRRVLWWRDKSQLTGSSAPSEGSSPPYNYVEFAPSPSLLNTFPAQPTASTTQLNYWDVRLAFRQTENGEAPLSD